MGSPAHTLRECQSGIAIRAKSLTIGADTLRKRPFPGASRVFINAKLTPIPLTTSMTRASVQRCMNETDHAWGAF